MKEHLGSVCLVGAGCGREDLITLRGLNALRQCDAVVYDDLIAEELLSIAPDKAEKWYMGKRGGRHSASQEEICGALINLARQGKRVVRLKGGDPFVFGRGGEEMLALQAAGVSCEEVPGITSAIAIPAAAGIPVTHRNVSRSVHIITGHTAGGNNGLPEELPRLAHLSGTLVFLMGLRHLKEIADGLMESGMPPDTPAAVISGGNSHNPAAVRAPLACIADSVVQSGLQTPAVIVVGAVAAMDVSTAVKRPLSGVRVGITGTQAMLRKLSAALNRQGADTVRAECTRLRELPLSYPLDQLLDGRQRWLVFTSGNGVQIFFSRLAEQNIDLRKLSACRFAVIGQATGEALRCRGIYADLCPAQATSAALASALCQKAALSEEILLFRSAHGAAVLPQVLQDRGFFCRDVALYEMEAQPEAEGKQRNLLEELDYLTFSSAGGVELFCRNYGGIPKKPVCVCIGEVTAHALKKVTSKSFLTAEETSADGIVKAILLHRSSV